MLGEGQTFGAPRGLLIELCDELLENRQLLARLGADLRTVANRLRDT